MNQFQMNQMMMNMNYNNNQIPNQFHNINDFHQNIINQNMNQINPNMNQINNFNQNNDAEDVLPYINEPKILLKFSTISTIKKGKYITVKLPKSITKSDLYSIAKKYQTDYYSNIILSCNNYLIKEDYTSIEGIPEGSVINIIEDMDFPDGSYYKLLMKINKNYQKIPLIFEVLGEITKTIEFPKNITIPEMIKGAFSNLLINSKSYRFNNIKSNDNSKLDIFPVGKRFTIWKLNPMSSHLYFGTLINAKTYYNKSPGDIISIGTLNSIKQLIKEIELSIYPNKIKKLFIEKNEFLINLMNDSSLRSLGINENFECDVEY